MPLIVATSAATARGSMGALAAGGGSQPFIHPKAAATAAWPVLMAEGVPLVQVDGLDDLAPLAAPAPPGVPDLPEGDIIIALGDLVGVRMIIISSITIILSAPRIPPHHLTGIR